MDLMISRVNVCVCVCDVLTAGSVTDHTLLATLLISKLKPEQITHACDF